MSHPVYMIGLDAFDRELMDTWIDDGLLPNLARLQNEAARWSLSSSTEVLQGSVWPSFATSTCPGHHAMYFAYQCQPGKDGLIRMDASGFRTPPFWSTLSNHGKKSVVIDVPKLGMVARDRDIQVVEWGAMDHYSQFASYPSSLLPELRAKFGDHVLSRPFKRPVDGAQEILLAEQLVRGVEKKLELTTWLIDRHRPDLCVSIFGESHAVGHYLWGQEGCADDYPGEAVQRVYRQMDDMIGTLIDRHAKHANLIVFSGHGMAPDYRPHWIVDELLVELGFLVLKRRHSKTGSQSRSEPRHSNARKNRLRRITAHLKQAIKQYAPKSITNRIHVMLQRRGNIDMRQSLAWSLPTDHQGFVRLNVHGREKNGAIAEGQYETVLEKISSEMLALRNASTGQPVIEKVYKLRELYHGAPNLDLLPDLALLWCNAPVNEVITSSGNRLAVSSPPASFRAANHTLSGFCFAVGPDVEARGDCGSADLMDLGATALQLIGTPAPDGLSGRALLAG